MMNKVYHINGGAYYRLPQVPWKNSYAGNSALSDACDGCAFKQDRDSCLNDPEQEWRAEPNLWCQDATYESTDSEADYTIDRDYIFVPATDEGFAAYVALRME